MPGSTRGPTKGKGKGFWLIAWILPLAMLTANGCRVADQTVSRRPTSRSRLRRGARLLNLWRSARGPSGGYQQFRQALWHAQLKPHFYLLARCAPLWTMLTPDLYEAGLRPRQDKRRTISLNQMSYPCKSVSCHSLACAREAVTHRRGPASMYVGTSVQL